ncbi:MAG TPA: DUF4873 domain-containing protein [Nocardioidaceae bacterium]|nr:DUF4873 domain-containing protein [Nocardioidaceae bacterium]
MDSHEDGYEGPLAVVVEEAEVTVDAILRGYFEPTDGRYHWYGRLAPSPELDAIVSGTAAGEVRTPYGAAEAKLGEIDPWGRFRVAGVGRPPFPVAGVD